MLQAKGTFKKNKLSVQRSLLAKKFPVLTKVF